MPLEKGRVEAKCVECDRIEEAQIEEGGKFRLRGLIPGNNYKIQLVSDLIERSVPEYADLKVEQKDALGLKFLAIMQSPFIEISGSIFFEGED